MTRSIRSFRQLVTFSFAAAALFFWCNVSIAASQFTFNPSAAGMNGASFTADKMNLSDYSAITFSDPTHFTQTGFLPVASLQLGGSLFTPTGLNAAGGYSLDFAYTGTGHLTTGTSAVTPQSGLFDTLTFTLQGAAGPSTFSYVGTTPTRTGPSAILLASGSLVTGTTDTSSAALLSQLQNLSFVVGVVAPAFFQSPNPFYPFVQIGQLGLSDAGSPTQLFENGVGSAVFMGDAGTPTTPLPAAVPLFATGLGAMGLLGWRRKRKAQAVA
jgi:hypothetical protein